MGAAQAVGQTAEKTGGQAAINSRGGVMAAMTDAGSASGAAIGYSPAESGTYELYDQISAHPTIALAMRMVLGPVLTNTWAFAARPGTDDAVLAFVRDALEPVLSTAKRDSLRAVEYGWAPFEKIWAARQGRLVIDRLKPLAPATTQVLADAHGNVRGLRNSARAVAGGNPGWTAAAMGPAIGENGALSQPVDLVGQKFWIYTHDSRYGDPFGRSRHENVREAWDQARQISQRLAQYVRKVSGIVVQLHYPEGTSRNAQGAERNNDVIAQEILEAVSAGRSVRFPNLFAAADDPRTAAELAGKAQWVLSSLDVGGIDLAGGLTNVLAYYDRLLFRGWLRPERVGLEAQHGTLADAQQHSDSSICDSELIDRELAAAFNVGVVDDLLTQNFGPAARGAVRIEPNPISEDRTRVALQVLISALNHPDSAAAINKFVRYRELLEDLDIPVTEPTAAVDSFDQVEAATGGATEAAS
jgi:hypothetical protein